MHEVKLISKIVGRAMRDFRATPIDKESLEMDIEAVHCNDMPLDLEALLAAPVGTFGHDVFGIRRFIDRSTGRLTEHFVPRTTRRATST